MQIYPAGTEVKTRFADVTGIITAAEIRYEMTYFNPADNSLMTSWHHESELEICGKTAKKQIGFNRVTK